MGKKNVGRISSEEIFKRTENLTVEWMMENAFGDFNKFNSGNLTNALLARLFKVFQNENSFGPDFTLTLIKIHQEVNLSRWYQSTLFNALDPFNHWNRRSPQTSTNSPNNKIQINFEELSPNYHPEKTFPERLRIDLPPRHNVIVWSSSIYHARIPADVIWLKMIFFFPSDSRTFSRNQIQIKLPSVVSVEFCKKLESVLEKFFPWGDRKGIDSKTVAINRESPQNIWHFWTHQKRVFHSPKDNRRE